jgi:hypothetical protein
MRRAVLTRLMARWCRRLTGDSSTASVSVCWTTDTDSACGCPLEIHVVGMPALLLFPWVEVSVV